NPGLLNLGKSGSFVMSVVVDGQALTAMPFSLHEQNSSDPFNPVKQFVRDGPFADFAFFSVVPDNPDGQVKFNYWTSLREVGNSKNAKVTLHVLVNGQELAATRGPIIPSVTDLQFVRDQELSVPTLPRNHWLTLSDLTKKDGEIMVVVKANGQPIKAYKTAVSGGHLQRLPQNALNWEP